ncbi:hypothetical protein ACS0TY_023326 [Phlomoides rotata]
MAKRCPQNCCCFTVNPVQVYIGNVDQLDANKSITHHVEVLSPMDKRLEQILSSQELGTKIIIFCSIKKMYDQLASNLNNQFGAAAIHGDKSQGERDYALQQFCTGRKILKYMAKSENIHPLVWDNGTGMLKAGFDFYEPLLRESPKLSNIILCFIQGAEISH